MIVVDVELNPGGLRGRGAGENLCTVHVVNDGTGTRSRGNYDVRLYARGNGRLVRTARVENWPRNAKPAWRLIAAAMKALDEAASR